MLLKLNDWLKPLVVDRTARLWCIVAIIANVLAWLLIGIRLWPLLAQNRVIALHYSVAIGVNDVGPALLVLLTPAIGTVTLIANAALARMLYGRERISALTLLGLTAFYETLTLVSAFYSVLINLKR
jgi:hypothetical protein